MKPAAFAYRRATSVAEAVAWLGEDPDAKVIAGGQSLIPLMNFRLSRPDSLIDIMHIEGLTDVQVRGDKLHLGTLLRHEALSQHETVLRTCPVLAEAAGNVGHWAIRNRGTLGGSLAHADPASELPAACVALGATFHLASTQGTRHVAARDFYLGFLTTAMEPGELLVGVEVPLHSEVRYGFSEIARRPGDFALAGAFVELSSQQQGAVTWFGIGGGPERRPVVLTADRADRARVWREALQSVEMLDEDAYRIQAAMTVAERAYDQAVGRNC